VNFREIDRILAEYQNEDYKNRYDYDDPVIEEANIVVETLEKLDLLLDGVDPEIVDKLARWAG